MVLNILQKDKAMINIFVLLIIYVKIMVGIIKIYLMKMLLIVLKHVLMHGIITQISKTNYNKKSKSVIWNKQVYNVHQLNKMDKHKIIIMPLIN